MSRLRRLVVSGSKGSASHLLAAIRRKSPGVAVLFCSWLMQQPLSGAYALFYHVSSFPTTPLYRDAARGRTETNLLKTKAAESLGREMRYPALMDRGALPHKLQERAERDGRVSLARTHGTNGSAVATAKLLPMRQGRAGDQASSACRRPPLQKA